MNEHSFLRDISADLLNRNAEVRISLSGKYTDLLRPRSVRAKMGWNGILTWENRDELIFEYPKRVRPNSRWPWPLRLMRSGPTIVVEWIEIHSLDGTLLFRFRPDNWSVYLAPKDTIKFAPGAIKISL